ncbi:MAG: DUF3501 family protein [Xanthomonadales bacterium]|nr:DUF3501 family protein [Xanthomonadales bacterium]
MAAPLKRSDLMSLEQYSQQRSEFRSKVIAHKKHRRVGIGPHLFLYFEDRLTIQYQVQEMLRIEKIFETDGIEEELSAYNPLIPDGQNLKATAMLEYQDVDERKQQLALLRGIEDLVWIQVGDFDPVYAISNEDLERSNAEKTSAVHFMRFELAPDMIAALRGGAALNMGSNHESYRHSTDVEQPVLKALLADLD